MVESPGTGPAPRATTRIAVTPYRPGCGHASWDRSDASFYDTEKIRPLNETRMHAGRPPKTAPRPRFGLSLPEASERCLVDRHLSPAPMCKDYLVRHRANALRFEGDTSVEVDVSEQCPKRCVGPIHLFFLGRNSLGQRENRLGKPGCCVSGPTAQFNETALDIGCAEPTYQASFLGRASEFLMRKFRSDFSRENSGSTDTGSAGAPYHP